MLSGDFHISMCKLIRYCYQHNVCKISFMHVSSAAIDHNRNKIFSHAREQQFDYMIQIDSDMTFPPNYIEHLIWMAKDHRDAAVTAGVAFLGNPPHYPAFFQWDETHTGHYPVIEYPTDNPFHVDILGGYGFCVPRKVIKQLPDNPFDRLPIPDNIDKTKTNLSHTYYSEDFSFCKRLEDAHIKIIVDPTVELGHVRPQIICSDHFKATIPQQDHAEK